MGNRRKKSGKRTRPAISASGSGSISGHAADMVWLANEYRRRSSSDPFLTPEDFAAEYSISVDRLRFYLPELTDEFGHSIILWHGTTQYRAKSIFRHGFRAEKAMKRSRGQIYFTQKPSVARRYARTKARDEGDRPAVIMYSIDLSHYSDYEREGTETYAFNHECIGREVIRELHGISKRRLEKLERQENIGAGPVSVEPTDVALTFNSGRAGIAYWVNSYMRLREADRISEDHEAVGKIKQWLDLQANAGRFGVVPDDELLEQIQQYLPLGELEE